MAKQEKAMQVSGTDKTLVKGALNALAKGDSKSAAAALAACSPPVRDRAIRALRGR